MLGKERNCEMGLIGQLIDKVCGDFFLVTWREMLKLLMQVGATRLEMALSVSLSLLIYSANTYNVLLN